MISADKIKEATDYLQRAAEILKPEQPYTMIELLAVFNNGIKTIDKPVLKPYSFTNPHPSDNVEY